MVRLAAKTVPLALMSIANDSCVAAADHPAMVPRLDRSGIALLGECLASAQRYIEYGCGGSTLFALTRSKAHVFSVESDAAWAAKVAGAAGDHSSRLDLEAVDVGPCGPWGRPLGYSHRRNFLQYIESPWRRAQCADLVLVDGRFRVACFCKSVLAAAPGTTILFDDYLTRTKYHVVEEVLKPAGHAGRLARFVCPEGPVLNRAAAEAMVAEFKIVAE